MLIKEKKLSLRLDVGLADRLQGRADRERVPVSYLLRHLVVRFLGEPQEGAKPALSALRRVPAATIRTRAEQLQDEFRAEVCALFDGFIAQGADLKSATRRTNFSLRAKKHPWATYDVIAKVLRDAGRFRKRKGVKP